MSESVSRVCVFGSGLRSKLFLPLWFQQSGIRARLVVVNGECKNWGGAVWWEGKLLIVEEVDASTFVCPWFKGCIRRVYVTFGISDSEGATQRCIQGEVSERGSWKAWNIRDGDESDHSQCGRSCVKEDRVVYFSWFFMVYTGDVLPFQDSTG